MVKNFQVVGIGNAIIDIFSSVDDSFLKKIQVEKGVMNLTSNKRAKFLLSQIKLSGKVAGGSAANTIVGLSQLGIATAYIGKVCDDELGNFFSDDLIENQVVFKTKKSKVNENYCTGHCIVLITPDGERTMNTHLGVTEYLSKEDIEKKMLRDCEWLYLEGYRYDGVDSKSAFAMAINETKKSGGKIALSLSDPFCVERHRKDFIDIIKNGVDLVFCNEHELKSLTHEQNFESALRKSFDFPCDIVCTASSKGAFIQNEDSWSHIPTKQVQPYDSTGAGDLFATGFLFGLIEGVDKYDSGKLGNKFATAIIQTLGCRLSRDKMSKLIN